MKTWIMSAAVCCLLAIAAGFIPTETKTNGEEIPQATFQETIQPQLPVDWLAQTESPDPAAPDVAEVDDSIPDLPLEEPAALPAQSVSSESTKATAASCPAGSRCPVHARAGSGHRDRVVFDGDGYLIDRRGAAASSGDGDRFPVLRRVLGVERRQNRRAAGHGVFGRRC